MTGRSLAFNAAWTATAAPRRGAKRALVTGVGPNGIGGETVLGLVRALPTLEEIFICTRDQNKAEAVADAARKTVFPAKLQVHCVPLDLSALSSVRECAQKVTDSLGDEPLDIAVLNAGVMACPLKYTADGLEYQYGVNHMGHAMLALLLRNRLQRSIFVSSTAVAISRSRTKPPLVSEKLRSDGDAKTYQPWSAYGDSKLAMSMFARGLALDGVNAVSLHPGVVNTELQRHVVPAGMYEWGQQKGAIQDSIRYVLSLFGFKTPAQGAELSIKLATEESDIRWGALYFERNREAPNFMAPLLQDDELCKLVMEDTINFLKSHVEEQDASILTAAQ